MLPKSSGFHKPNIKENLQELFNFNIKVAKASPLILFLKTPKEFLNFFTIKHKSEIYIYNDNKKNLVGFLAVIYSKSEKTIEILSIMVDPVFQRQGHGKRIVMFVEDLARKSNLIKIKLVTNVKNVSAITFYKNLGYKIVSKAINHYGDGETRHTMEKSI